MEATAVSSRSEVERPPLSPAPVLVHIVAQALRDEARVSREREERKPARSAETAPAQRVHYVYD